MSKDTTNRRSRGGKRAQRAKKTAQRPQGTERIDVLRRWMQDDPKFAEKVQALLRRYGHNATVAGGELRDLYKDATTPSDEVAAAFDGLDELAWAGIAAVLYPAEQDRPDFEAIANDGSVDAYERAWRDYPDEHDTLMDLFPDAHILLLGLPVSESREEFLARGCEIPLGPDGQEARPLGRYLYVEDLDSLKPFKGPYATLEGAREDGGQGILVAEVHVPGSTCSKAPIILTESDPGFPAALTYRTPIIRKEYVGGEELLYTFEEYAQYHVQDWEIAGTIAVGRLLAFGEDKDEDVMAGFIARYELVDRDELVRQLRLHVATGDLDEGLLADLNEDAEVSR